MAYKIHIRARAIYIYSINNWGISKASEYYYEIVGIITSLIDNPYKDVPCNYIKEDYRKYHINKHCILYKVTDNIIYIVRILSDKMGYSKHF